VAGVVDILLRVLGDSRDAVRAVDDVGQAADRTEAKVGRLRTTVARTMQAVAGIAAAIGTAAAAGQFGGELIDSLQGEAGDIATAERRLANPTSAADAAAALRSSASNRAGQFSWGRWFRQGGDLLTGKDAPWNVGGQDRGRELRARFREMAAGNPALAAAVLAELGNPADLAAIYAEEVQRAAQSSIFQQSIAPSGRGGAPTIIVNTGVGDPNRIGDEVRANLERAQRNNARYTTTLNRP